MRRSREKGSVRLPDQEHPARQPLHDDERGSQPRLVRRRPGDVGNRQSGLFQRPQQRRLAVNIGIAAARHVDRRDLQHIAAERRAAGVEDVEAEGEASMAILHHAKMTLVRLRRTRTVSGAASGQRRDDPGSRTWIVSFFDRRADNGIIPHEICTAIRRSSQVFESKGKCFNPVIALMGCCQAPRQAISWWAAADFASTTMLLSDQSARNRTWSRRLPDRFFSVIRGVKVNGCERLESPAP